MCSVLIFARPLRLSCSPPAPAPWAPVGSLPSPSSPTSADRQPAARALAAGGLFRSSPAPPPIGADRPAGASRVGLKAAAAVDKKNVYIAAAADSETVGIVICDNDNKIVGIVTGVEPGRA